MARRKPSATLTASWMVSLTEWAILPLSGTDWRFRWGKSTRSVTAWASE
jgi:hypothetical protein